MERESKTYFSLQWCTNLDDSRHPHAPLEGPVGLAAPEHAVVSALVPDLGLVPAVVRGEVHQGVGLGPRLPHGVQDLSNTRIKLRRDK